MSWSMVIKNPIGTTRKTITDLSSEKDFLKNEPTIYLGPYGQPELMEFNCKQTGILDPTLRVKPNDIITWTKDGTLISGGVVVSCPSVESAGSGIADSNADDLEKVTCVGFDYLLDNFSVVRYFFYDKVLTTSQTADYASIFYDLALEYVHPALSVGIDNFETGAGAPTVVYSPFETLGNIMRKVAEQVGYIVYVDKFQQIKFVSAV